MWGQELALRGTKCPLLPHPVGSSYLLHLSASAFRHMHPIRRIALTIVFTGFDGAECPCHIPKKKAKSWWILIVDLWWMWTSNPWGRLELWVKHFVCSKARMHWSCATQILASTGISSCRRSSTCCQTAVGVESRWFPGYGRLCDIDDCALFVASVPNAACQKPYDEEEFFLVLHFLSCVLEDFGFGGAIASEEGWMSNLGDWIASDCGHGKPFILSLKVETPHLRFSI